MAEEVFERRILYKYSIGHMLPKDKILMFYELKGRNGRPGLMSKLGVQRLGLCMLLVPAEAEEQFDEFLKKWNCPFSKRNTMVDAT